MKLLNLFQILVLINLLALILIYLTLSHTQSQSTPKFENPMSIYGFHQPILSYHLLRRFDLFEPVPQIFYDAFTPPLNRFNIPKLGLIREDDYCDKVRAYFIDYPMHPFFEQNIFTDFDVTSPLRQDVIPSVGFDSMLEIRHDMPKALERSRLFELKPNVMNFFTESDLHSHQHLGRNFACGLQMYNHIPGDSYLSRKDRFNAMIGDYMKSYEHRPKCLSYKSLFPRAWVLNREKQCEDFFENYFSGPAYEEVKQANNIVFIRKDGSTKKKFQSKPLIGELEEALRKEYKNGTLCGKRQKSTMIQYYIPNPFLIYGHKFDIRAFMLISSTNPLVAYYYDGFLKLALNLYDIRTTDEKVLFNRPALSREIIEKAHGGETVYGLNETELLNFQSWNYEKLYKYLWDNQRILDPAWLNTYLRPSMKLAMIHLLRATHEKFLVRSSVYELCAVDFLLDDELNLWVMDIDTTPQLEGKAPWKRQFYNKMLSDVFEVTIGLIRSKMRRVIDFINVVSLDTSGNEMNGFLYIPDFEKKLKEFKNITTNYYEMDFAPGLMNRFDKIVDYNLEGPQRFSGILEEECL